MRLWLAVLFLTLAACNYNKVKTPGDNTGLRGEKLQNPDFAVVMQAVIGPKCNNCHSNAGGNKGNANLETYQNVRQWATRVRYRAIEAGDMPPGGLRDADKSLLDRWLKNGAPEKVTGVGQKPGGDLSQGPTNWNKISTKIFADKCIACHQQPSPDGGIDLGDVKEVKKNILKILGSIFGDGVKPGTMPPPPVPVVSEPERDVLLKWFNLGMPE